MTITLALAWWHIPTLVTILTLAALLWPSQETDDGYLAGMADAMCRLFLMIPGLGLLMVMWILVAVFK